MTFIFIAGCKDYKWHFFSQIHVFFNVESESEIHFRRLEPETLSNPDKPKSSGLSEVSGAG